MPDIPLTSVGEQSAVFDRALEIFAARNRVRRDLWRQANVQRFADQCRERVERVESTLAAIADVRAAVEHAGDTMSTPPDIEENDLWRELEDDALDMINYAAFIIRKSEEARS